MDVEVVLEDSLSYNEEPVNSGILSGKPSSSTKPSKLGAKKLNETFDDIEARAKQEQLEALKAAEEMTLASASSPKPLFSAPFSPKEERSTQPAIPASLSKEQQDNLDRLGMGVGRVSLFDTSKSKAKTQAYESTTEAQKRFGDAKGISSDQFFDRDNHASDSSRIRDFENASSISSNQYFQRESNSGRDSPTDFANSLVKVVVSDLKTAKDVIQNSGSKISEMLQKMQGN